MNEVSEQQKKMKKNKKRLIGSVILTAGLLLLIIGVTYAWFVNRENITTLVSVTPPSAIAILGPEGKGLTALDLVYTDENKEGNTVTIQRVISVSTDADQFQLEIAHTTNLQGLKFTLYPATLASSEAKGNTVTDKGSTYSYNQAEALGGEFINRDKEEKNYQYADSSIHDKNYDKYENVQAHAEPIYWVSKEQKSLEKGNESISFKNLNYYVIEVSWTESTKETDIFYILAKNM